MLKLGETDFDNWTYTERLQSHLGEIEIPIGETEIIATGNREFASPSRLDRDPIGVTELIRVSGSGYVKRTRWRRIERIGRVELDFWFRTYVDVGK